MRLSLLVTVLSRYDQRFANDGGGHAGARALVSNGTHTNPPWSGNGWSLQDGTGVSGRAVSRVPSYLSLSGTLEQLVGGQERKPVFTALLRRNAKQIT